MTLVTDSAGTPWLQPQNLRVADIATALQSPDTPETVSSRYQITANDWSDILPLLLGTPSMASFPPDVRDAVRLADISARLGPYALCVSGYASVADLDAIETCLGQTPIPEATIHQRLFALVMQPRVRAQQLVGRFLKISLFEEFAYLIDAASMAFYRGNRVCAFLSLLPVIEGLLLRWQGYPGPVASRPSYKKSIQFLADAPTRQPYPASVLFFVSWGDAAAAILRDHLFLDTTSGTAVGYFSRHLALHLLEDREFATTENIARLFLLLDVLSDLYLAERRIPDPRFMVSDDETRAHVIAYTSALRSQDQLDQPERILRVHPKCRK
jgi:hypothetical protein